MYENVQSVRDTCGQYGVCVLFNKMAVENSKYDTPI